MTADIHRHSAGSASCDACRKALLRDEEEHPNEYRAMVGLPPVAGATDRCAECGIQRVGAIHQVPEQVEGGHVFVPPTSGELLRNLRAVLGGAIRHHDRACGDDPCDASDEWRRRMGSVSEGLADRLAVQHGKQAGMSEKCCPDGHDQYKKSDGTTYCHGCRHYCEEIRDDS